VEQVFNLFVPAKTGCKNAEGFGGVLDNRNGWGLSPEIAGSDGVNPVPLSFCDPR